ncbi:unnamed protein product, partial [Echinostoma caproni]|uniref:C2H2-type domain-containing protein n=1 Tax=Echinostoma caproni TaxID=27848 RepID=A0A183B1X0_9TREM
MLMRSVLLCNLSKKNLSVDLILCVISKVIVPLPHLSCPSTLQRLLPCYSNQMVSSDQYTSPLSVSNAIMGTLKLCPYCLTKTTHPRLGRGESYVCGYKPYRCEVCNYSTTTKGNLAIHQQSDKHLNNIQVSVRLYDRMRTRSICLGRMQVLALVFSPITTPLHN